MRTTVRWTGLALLVLMFSMSTVEAQVSPAAATGSGSVAGKITDPSPAPGAPIPGTLRGTVTDPTGMAVPARITIVEESTGRSYAANTDSDGVYRFENLPMGRYCPMTYDAGEWGTSTLNEGVVSSSQVTTRDIRLPAKRERVEVCSCLIETEPTGPAKPGIALHIYAENSIATPGSPLWVTVTLTNLTKHDVVFRSVEGFTPIFDYQIYAVGRCGCSGQLRSEGIRNADASKQLGTRGSTNRVVRLLRGRTLTSRFDLSSLMDLRSASAYEPAYAIQVRSFDPSNAANGGEARDLPLVSSNWIRVRVMTAH